MADRLLFADPEGRLYAHPELGPAATVGEAFARPGGRPIALPAHATLSSLPGRRPVGLARDGSLVVLDEVTVGRRTFKPDAVGCVLPPGYTRLSIPAYSARPFAPVLTQWAYTTAAADGERHVAWAARTDARSHWDAGDPARDAAGPTLRGAVEAKLAADGDNRVWKQISRCALEYRCFTAQNSFLERDEGAIPASVACNAHCVGCISEQIDTGCDASHERMEDGPSAEEMARMGAAHLERATGRPMISFGQGCEGEPLTKARAIAESIRLVRARTGRGSINVNTNGSLTKHLGWLIDAGLDAVRVSLNSASKDLYEAYYRPVGYGWEDVERSIALAKRRGVYVALNLLCFPGVTDREGELAALEALVRRHGVDQVQTRSLAIDPAMYLAIARGKGAGGDPVGMSALLARLRRLCVVGNFARGLAERIRDVGPRRSRKASPAELAS